MAWDDLIKERTEEDRSTINDAGEDYERPVTAVKAYGIKRAKSNEDVMYTSDAEETDPCNNCRYYNTYGYYGTETPVDAGYCNLVEGAIDPDGTCKLFEDASGPFN